MMTKKLNKIDRRYQQTSQKIRNSLKLFNLLANAETWELNRLEDN